MPNSLFEYDPITGFTAHEPLNNSWPCLCVSLSFWLTSNWGMWRQLKRVETLKKKRKKESNTRGCMIEGYVGLHCILLRRCITCSLYPRCGSCLKPQSTAGAVAMAATCHAILFLVSNTWALGARARTLINHRHTLPSPFSPDLIDRNLVLLWQRWLSRRWRPRERREKREIMHQQKVL